MRNIYEKQMKKLKLNEEQYSKLTGIPLEILEKLLRNKKVSNDMKLNEFFRKNTAKIHNELEENKEKSELDSIKIRLEDKEDNNDYMKWYLDEYNKEEFIENHKLKSVTDFYNKTCILSNNKKGKTVKASKSVYNRLLCKDLNSIGKKILPNLVKQLYDYNTNSTNGEMNSNDELKLWFSNFNIKDFLKFNDLSVEDFSKNAGISCGTVFNLSKKGYTPSITVIDKVKHCVDNFYTYKKNVVEPVEEIEVLDEFEDNDYTDNGTMEKEEKKEMIQNISNQPCTIPSEKEILIELLKERLTEKEKYLIKLFGGNID